MKIQIEVKNEVLGDSIFWAGDSKDIEDIPNLPARIAAKSLLRTGQTYKFGMWVASEIKEEK